MTAPSLGTPTQILLVVGIFSLILGPGTKFKGAACLPKPALCTRLLCPRGAPGLRLTQYLQPRPHSVADRLASAMNSGFDCSAVGGSFSSHTTGTTRVCISDSDPSVWKCPENFVRLAAAPFCKAKPRGGKTCKVPRMEQPLHVFLNHCSEGQVLADGEACDLSCLKTWRMIGVQPSCQGGVFKPGTIQCKFMAKKAAEPTPTRGARICRNLDAKVHKPIPRVAFCMTGHVRSLHQSKNYHSLKYNMLDAFGADSKVFGYLKFDEFKSNKHDEDQTEGRKMNKPAPQLVTRAMVEPALRELDFANLSLANDVYPPPIAGKDANVTWACHQNDGMSSTGNDWGEYTFRTVAQLIALRKCYGMVEEFERRTQTKFDMVVRLRPDDFWMKGIPPYCMFKDLLNTSWFGPQFDIGNQVYGDHFYMLPREVAPLVFKMSDAYYALKDTTLDTTPTCFMEGWIMLLLRNHAKANKGKFGIMKNYQFPRMLHRGRLVGPGFNNTANTKFFCQNSVLYPTDTEYHWCDPVEEPSWEGQVKCYKDLTFRRERLKTLNQDTCMRIMYTNS